MKIYTVGKMSGLPYEKQMGWRTELEYTLNKFTDEPVTVINPPLFYNYEAHNHRSEAEIKEWELSKLRECDIVVVNLDGIDSSVGSHFELAFADAINQFGGRHIFVIGIGDDSNVHPWIRESLFRTEATAEAASRFIAEYLVTGG